MECDRLTIAIAHGHFDDSDVGTGVHRDVALRLKNLSINLPGESPIDPGRDPQPGVQ